jgi:hypothetical protein
VPAEELRIALAGREPELVPRAGIFVAHLADVLVHLLPVVFRLQIAQDAKEHRQRRQPLLAVDDIGIRPLRILDKDDAAEEVGGKFARRFVFQRA